MLIFGDKREYIADILDSFYIPDCVKICHKQKTNS